MGLFDKKFCDICGNKIGMLGNRKLEDGNLCKDCAAKLSPWFSDRRASTVEDIRGQLEYREANKQSVAMFNTTSSFGSEKKLLLDENNGMFMIAATRNLAQENPDVLGFNQVTGCDIDVDENKSEQKTTDAEGHSVSYNPPRYKYNYNIYFIVQVNHPYFNEMKFKLNDSTIVIDPYQNVPSFQRNNYGAVNRPMNNQPRPGTVQARPTAAPRPGVSTPPQRPSTPAPQRPGVSAPPRPNNTAARTPSPTNNLAAMNRSTVPNNNVAKGIPANRPTTPTRPAANPVAGTTWANSNPRPANTGYNNNVNRGFGNNMAGAYGNNAYGNVNDPQYLLQNNVEYQRCMEMAETIRAKLMQIHDDIRQEAYEAAQPKMKVNCPACGASTIPDENGCCEFCGSSLVGLF